MFLWLRYLRSLTISVHVERSLYIRIELIEVTTKNCIRPSCEYIKKKKNIFLEGRLVRCSHTERDNVRSCISLKKLVGKRMYCVSHGKPVSRLSNEFHCIRHCSLKTKLLLIEIINKVDGSHLSSYSIFSIFASAYHIRGFYSAGQQFRE